MTIGLLSSGRLLNVSLPLSPKVSRQLLTSRRIITVRLQPAVIRVTNGLAGGWLQPPPPGQARKDEEKRATVHRQVATASSMVLVLMLLLPYHSQAQGRGGKGKRSICQGVTSARRGSPKSVRAPSQPVARFSSSTSASVYMGSRARRDGCSKQCLAYLPAPSFRCSVFLPDVFQKQEAHEELFFRHPC